MLSDHGLKISSKTRPGSPYEKYHDLLYALRHFSDGMAYWRLPGICCITIKLCKFLLERGEKIGHFEKGKRNYAVTKKGIEYNNLWFGIQDRYGIHDLVSSTFIIDDIFLEKRIIEKINSLRKKNFTPYTQKKNTTLSSYRSMLNEYLDMLRALRKYSPRPLSNRKICTYTGIPPSRLKRLEEIALKKGHIRKGEPRREEGLYVPVYATREGLNLLYTVEWLAAKDGLLDLLPTLVPP